MEKKTSVIKFRVTPQYLSEIKKKSAPFGTVSNYLIQALREFSNTTSREKIEVAKSLAEKYSALDVQLAHIGGNLNQAMKRVNERKIAGIDYDSLLITSVLPEVLTCIKQCDEVRKALKEITYKVVK